MIVCMCYSLHVASAPQNDTLDRVVPDLHSDQQRPILFVRQLTTSLTAVTTDAGSCSTLDAVSSASKRKAVR